MKYLSQVYSQASGSIGGITYSHNRFGLYTRSRITPTNPQTGFQTQVRNAMSSLADRWVNVLTQAQRDAWTLYADNVPVLDKLGQSINLTGMNMYIRSNVPRVQFDQIASVTVPTVDAGPTNFSLAETDPTAAMVMTAPQAGAISFDTGLPWVGEDDAFLLPYSGRPQNASIDFFKGPYRLCLPVEGDSITPPTSPGSNTSLYVYTAGQKCFSYARISRADGRLSPAFQLQPVVVV